MTVADILKDTDQKMKRAVEAAGNDFATLRTGRANPAMLDSLKVDYYGQTLPVNQLAAISIPEPRTILLTPWDKGAFPAIEKAIQKSDLGMVPNNDGVNIRLNVPVLTTERRKDMVKQLSQKAEAARVSIRNHRRNAVDLMKKDEEITEDDAKRGEKEVQKLLDKYVVEVEALIKAKEGELLEQS